MTNPRQFFEKVSLSLADLVGNDYVESVCEARAFLGGEDLQDLRSLATQPVDFLPQGFQDRIVGLLPKVGERVCGSKLKDLARGATTKDFVKASKHEFAPLSAYGLYRIGESGRLHLITKSEHYHAPVGHSFPGYQLVERAKRLGIPNATHNNTRGHITRLLEERLVCEANGLEPGDSNGLQRVLDSSCPNTVNRVLNLETGSLAAEAALKMMLARFYRPQEDSDAPRYEGRVPVFLVVGNDDGGLHANYHGTTTLTQMMRGMWPELTSKLDQAGLIRFCAIRPNRIEDLQAAFQQSDIGENKIAGFFHEIVMMNYGARRLTREFLHRAYELCREHDVPTMVDEIQSCMWAPGFFMYREYELEPSFVALGKGFPGGEYPASRILFSSEYDNLPQFGALVTNGQEELASLAYLITMAWAKANTEVTRGIGDYYQERLREFAAKHPDRIAGIDGVRHMSSLCFRDLVSAKTFVKQLVQKGLDISVQTYKADCPPVVLTKLPLVTPVAVVDFVLERMNEAMKEIG